MKKLLLGSVAILGVAATAPAHAESGVQLDIGGHFKGYVSYVDQDENQAAFSGANSSDVRAVDILRETEVWLSGETVLDNGLTVGAHFEMEADGSDTSAGATDSFDVEESYVYFSGAWGRVNFGAEDGAAYLLQVAAPSADSNLDGIRQYLNPVNYVAEFSSTLRAFAVDNNGESLLSFDYDQDLTDRDNKVTYLTPVLNGFQAGVSWTPELSDSAEGTRSIAGPNVSNQENDPAGEYGTAWDFGVRWEGQLDEVGITIGGGYTVADLEANDTAAGAGVIEVEDQDIWNAGIDFDWGPFGLGVVYTENDLGVDGTGTDNTLDSDSTTWVVGLDYTTGPFKLGASYLNNEVETEALLDTQDTGDVDTERWTGGVVYTYGPGMTFRGTISWIDHDIPTALNAATGDDDSDATSVMLGTQINF